MTRTDGGFSLPVRVRGRQRLRRRAPVLLERWHVEQLERQPPAGHRPGLLLRQPLPRPPGRGADQLQRRRRAFQGADALQLNTLDGAAPGGPDADHVNNANMFTPPDGPSPVMQMYLWRSPFRNISSGSDAAILYHEYTHGLSNRLVDRRRRRRRAELRRRRARWGRPGATGTPRTSSSASSRRSTPAPRARSSWASTRTRARRTCGRSRSTAPSWAPTRSAAPGAPCSAPAATRTATSGGSPAAPRSTPTARSGRRRCGTCGPRWGSAKARALVTTGMALLPPEPSFLDGRNGILLADQTLYGGSDVDALWSRVRRPRDGLLRGRAGRRGHRARRELRAAARRRRAEGHDLRARDQPARRRSGRGRHRRARRAEHATRATTDADGQLHDRRRPRGHVPEGRRGRRRLRQRGHLVVGHAAGRRSPTALCCGATGRRCAAGRRSPPATAASTWTTAAGPTPPSTSPSPPAGPPTPTREKYLIVQLPVDDRRDPVRARPRRGVRRRRAAPRPPATASRPPPTAPSGPSPAPAPSPAPPATRSTS